MISIGHGFVKVSEAELERIRLEAKLEEHPDHDMEDISFILGDDDGTRLPSDFKHIPGKCRRCLLQQAIKRIGVKGVTGQ